MDMSPDLSLTLFLFVSGERYYSALCGKARARVSTFLWLHVFARTRPSGLLRVPFPDSVLPRDAKCALLHFTLHDLQGF